MILNLLNFLTVKKLNVYHYIIEKINKVKSVFEIQIKGTMILYFTFIVATQLYLYHQWISFREYTIYEDCPLSISLNATIEKNCETMFLVNNDFGSKEYDQCNCIDSFVDACVETEEIQKNIVDFIPKEPCIIQLILLCNITLMLIFCFTQYFTSHYLPPPVTMKEFLLGPSLQTDKTLFVNDTVSTSIFGKHLSFNENIFSCSLNEESVNNKSETKKIAMPLSEADQEKDAITINLEPINISFKKCGSKNNPRNLWEDINEAKEIDSAFNHVKLDSAMLEKFVEYPDYKAIETAKGNQEKPCETIKLDTIDKESVISAKKFYKNNFPYKKIKCLELYLNGKISIVDIICCFFALMFLISIYNSQNIFYPYSYEWEKFCADGFYDSHPYPDILKCTGNY